MKGDFSEKNTPVAVKTHGAGVHGGSTGFREAALYFAIQQGFVY
jgi:hypothetical protein